MILTFLSFIGQQAVDRPDLVARVFYQKQQALLKIIHDGYFGTVTGFVYTIEYQKRGLPHMHLLNKLVLYGSSSFIVVSSHALHVVYIDFRLRHLSSKITLDPILLPPLSASTPAGKYQVAAYCMLPSGYEPW